jgi:hypothetical protein
MRPNLSLETIAGALAVLGTGVMLSMTPACGGDPKTPVNANEVNGATEKAADGANHCGAGKDHKAGQAGCSAAAGGDAKPADTSAAGGAAATATPAATTPAAATPADAKPADAKPADAKPADAKGATPAPASTTGKKAPAAPAGTPAKKGGSGSCGAGTCSAKK